MSSISNLFGYHTELYYDRFSDDNFNNGSKEDSNLNKFRIQRLEKINIAGYIPLISMISGFARIYHSITNDKWNISFRIVNGIRGGAEFIGLGTAILWLVDIIVTVGRLIALKCSQPSSSNIDAEISPIIDV